MNQVKLESIPSESSDSTKKNKPNTEEKNMPNPQKISPKTKIILLASIGLSICLIVAVVVVVLVSKKSNKKYENEISDLKTEKDVLENQNKRMKSEIQNLTDSNNDLNKTLSEKLEQVSSDEVKRNKTYQTLEDISKEGVSLKATFSKITNNIEALKVANTDNSLTQENKRELEENVNTLKGQLELIYALMAQISLNLDLVNQKKRIAFK